ncbi:MAG: FtsW/RodA/SpoVE family cell cycle protein [Lachnospiraceae bacterium]|nr:FtsW/RodA/SpoVE family cell cycle protein [Lachnospiraceae bacterium]
MANLIIEVSKYLLTICMVIYTVQSFAVFWKKSESAQEFLYLRQVLMILLIHFIAFMALYLKMAEQQLMFFWASQVLYLLTVQVMVRNLYPEASKLLLNNMCLLIAIGFIMITRLSYDQSIKQFQIIVVSSVIALFVPVIIRKWKFLQKGTWLYAIVGIGLLAAVAVLGQSSYGAKLSISIGPISIQPSEFVKIIFVFCIASMFAKASDFKQVVIATVLAAVHVLILVVSTDLGGALIFFSTYLMMLYAATRKPAYTMAGIAAGCVAAVFAYFLFSHVRVRVEIWRDPFASYEGSGYQIAQSLFAIGAGGWFGTGLFQGSPRMIPIVEQDFMFSAIAEEMGSIFCICLILIYLNCFMLFLNVAMGLRNKFYRIIGLGFGCMLTVQIFLTIGGAMKMIPSTGVTLPLISYGGSSVMSTLLIFFIIQGLYLIKEDEDEEIERARIYEQYQREYGNDSGQKQYGYPPAN